MIRGARQIAENGEAQRPAAAGSPAPAQRRAQMDVRPMAPIVPAANVSASALTTVIAIMAFLACLTLGAVSMVRDTAQSWQSQISREVTIQIKPADGLDIEQALVAARQSVIDFEGVRSANIIDRQSSARLLEPWLGENFDLEELPVPRLVVVTIDETAPPDFAAMRSAVEAAVPGAFLDDHRTWVDRLVAMANTTVFIGLSVLSLVCAATVLTVVFATRGALSGNRHIVEVLHFVGAEARFAAREFQRHFLLIGLKGAVIGGALAAFCFLVANFWAGRSIATPEADQAQALFGSFRIGFAGYAGILAIIVFIGLLTALTTRITVIRTIREIDLIRSDPSRMD
jgi:cell division transport system permease protein